MFGCIAYVHVLDELRTKLDPKTKKCVFIGYSLEQKGYKCYNPVTRQVRVNKDVVFDEMASWYVEEKQVIGADVKDNAVAENASPSSQVLSGPQGSSNVSAVLRSLGVAGYVIETALLAHQMYLEREKKRLMMPQGCQI